MRDYIVFVQDEYQRMFKIKAKDKKDFAIKLVDEIFGFDWIDDEEEAKLKAKPANDILEQVECEMCGDHGIYIAAFDIDANKMILGDAQ